MADRQGIIIDATGLELELDNSDPNVLNNSWAKLNLGTWFRRDRDASSETFLKKLTERLICVDPFGIMKNMRSMGTIAAGQEIISIPMYWPEVETAVPLLLMELSRIGELEKATRGAIHVHVGFPHSLSALKAALLLSTRFESLFYQLGTMGYTFRGDTNHAIYCRPHSGVGPPVVQCEDGRYRQVISVDDLLEADSLESFWRSLSVGQKDLKRYHPSRYFGINIYSVLLHGTLEFRHFNVTLNHRFLLSIMKLCQSTAEMLTKIPLRRLMELPQNPVTRSNDDIQLLEVLLCLVDEYADTYPVSSDYKNILRELIQTAPKYVMENEFTKSHLWGKFMLSDYYYADGSREVVSSDDIVNSGFLDSHQNAVNEIEFSKLVNR